MALFVVLTNFHDKEVWLWDWKKGARTSGKLWPMDQGNLVITFYKWLKKPTPVTSGLDFQPTQSRSEHFNQIDAPSLYCQPWAKLNSQTQVVTEVSWSCCRVMARPTVTAPGRLAEPCHAWPQPVTEAAHHNCHHDPVSHPLQDPPHPENVYKILDSQNSQKFALV